MVAQLNVYSNSPGVRTISLLLNVYNQSLGGSTVSLLLNVYNESQSLVKCLLPFNQMTTPFVASKFPL